MSEEPRTTAPGEAADLFQYWAFISYSHADEKWAAWLHRALERYRVPRGLIGRATTVGAVPRRIYPVFRDRDELPSSASLSEQVQQALRQSGALVVICSPHAAASRWVNEEVRAWQALGRGDRVFCLIVDGEPGASERLGSGLLEAFPEAVRLASAAGAGTDEGTEPLAADVRPGKDGRVAAKLKLAAGILDLRFDDLRRRDRRRRRWRAVQGAALAALVVALIGVIWWRGTQATRAQESIARARALAARSYEVPAGDERTRLQLALEAVEATGSRGSAPEAEVALYRALFEGRHVGAFAEGDTIDDFGGWTWPVAFNASGTRTAAASLASTVVLDSLGGLAAVLRDAEIPYENDYGVVYLGGDTLVTAGADGFVRIWTPAGEVSERFRAHDGDVLSVDVAAGGLLLTVGCDDGAGPLCAARSARLFDRRGLQLAQLSRPDADVTSAVALPDGRILTAGSEGLGFWGGDGRLQAEVAAGARWVSRRSIAPDGRFVTGACHPWRHAGMFAPLRPGLCDVQRPLVELRDAQGRVHATYPATLATFSPDGSLLAIAENPCEDPGGCRGNLSLLDVDGGRVADWAVAAMVVDIAFDFAGAQVAAAADDGLVSVRDVLGNPVAELGPDARGVTSLGFSPDGQRLAVVSCPDPAQGACLGRRIDLWDPDGPIAATYAFPAARHADFRGLPGDRDPVLVAWNGRSGMLVARNDGSDPRILGQDGSVEAVVPIGAAVVRQALFYRNGERLLLVIEENVQPFAEPRAIALYDARGERLATLASDPWSERMLDVVLGPRDEWILTTTPEGVLHRYDPDGAKLDSVKASESRIVDAAVSSTGSIATVDSAGTVRVWGSGLEPRGTFGVGSPGDREISRWDYGYVLRFTPAGSRLLIAGPDTLDMRNLDGEVVWSLGFDRADHTSPVMAGERILVVACTERGRGVTLGSTATCYDSHVEVRNLDGVLESTLTPPGDAETMFTIASVSSDAARIATLTEDGRVMLWTGAGAFLGEVSRGANWLAFAPDGDRLAVGKNGGRVEVHTIWLDVAAMVRQARRRLERSAPGR